MSVCYTCGRPRFQWCIKSTERSEAPYVGATCYRGRGRGAESVAALWAENQRTARRSTSRQDIERMHRRLVCAGYKGLVILRIRPRLRCCDRGPCRCYG